MAGLLSDVLPFLYSQGDRAKRYVGGLLSDPLGSLEQTAGLLGDKHREQQGLMERAFADQKKPFTVTDKQALMQAVNGLMAGPMGFAPAGITAWHGSPHVFDKFDSSKIGTGEGAQAYGHGLYLAENPGVAQSYKTGGGAFQTAMPMDNVMIDGKTWAKTLPRSSVESQAASVFSNDIYGKTIPEKAAKLRGANMEPVADWLEKNAGRLSLEQGALYKVDLPDSAVAKMLDWDAPLSKQAPEVQAAVKKIAALPEFKNGMLGEAVQPFEMGSTTGQTVQNLLSRYFNGDNDKAAGVLRRAGVPGIRYLDGGSRGAGQGSSNFVVFPGEESLLQILERNGQSLK